MQEQKQKRKNGDKTAMSNTIDKVFSDHKDISEQIKRDTSRLVHNEQLEELKKKMTKLYVWIWVLLGLSALLITIILLSR